MLKYRKLMNRLLFCILIALALLPTFGCETKTEIETESVNVEGIKEYVNGQSDYIQTKMDTKKDDGINPKFGIQYSGADVFNVTHGGTTTVKSLDVIDNVTNPFNSTWGIFNNGSCMVIGDLGYVSEC